MAIAYALITRGLPVLLCCLVGGGAEAAEVQAARIVVHKAERRMELLDKKGQVIRDYHVALGSQPVGHKTTEGDERTPEGKYIISGRNPGSHYHLSLRISYPNKQDVAQARKRKVSPGGDVMIHGLPNGYKLPQTGSQYVDWTNGCIAVTDDEIEEIWSLVPVGTPIAILP